MTKIFEIQADETKINLNPQTEIEEIMQNINTLLITPKNSVPLDRAFGIDMSFLDRPPLQARAAISAEVYQAIQKYEPRVKVEKVSFTVGGVNGEKLIPKVQVSLI